MKRSRWLARQLTTLCAVAASCLLTACQGTGSSAAASTNQATAPAAAAGAAGPSPIIVTVAPAALAPGAARTGVPAWVAPTPTVSAPTPVSPAPPVLPAAPPCARYPSPKQIPVQVSPGSGTATVSWRSDGDASVQSYRITAVSQQLVAGSQPAPPTATVPRGVGCSQLGLTLSGLAHAVRYVFWLEEASPDPVSGTLRYTLVGQSTGVLIP